MIANALREASIGKRVLAVGRILDSTKKAFVIGSHQVALSRPGRIDATDP